MVKHAMAGTTAMAGNTVNNLNTGWTGGGGVGMGLSYRTGPPRRNIFTQTFPGSNNGGWGGWVSNHSKTEHRSSWSELSL